MAFSLSCASPIKIKDGYLVPCGKCFNCRRKYRHSWTIRLLHELIEHGGNAVFLTLSYDNEHLPPDKSVSVRDCQLFFKRLRKHYKYSKIKYFLCSEYGDKNLRPHYHLILYGLSCPAKKSERIALSNFISKKIWKNGYCFVGEVNRKTIVYTTKYLMKQFAVGSKHLDLGLKPTFSLKSTGLGLSYLLKHSESILDNIKNDVPITFSKIKVGYPRYYRRKLIELGLLPEDFYFSRYTKYNDNLLPTVKKELQSCGVVLDHDKNYLDISVDTLFNLDKCRNFPSGKIRISNDSYFMPLSMEQKNDILSNHWFMIYKKYVKFVNDKRSKYFADNYTISLYE